MEKQPLQILPVQSGQFETLADLSAETFRTSFADQNTPENMERHLREAYHPEKMRLEIANPDNHFFIVWLDKEAAGYLKLRTGEPLPELAGKRALELERIYVRHEYHGQKFGAALMAFAIQYTASAGCDVLWLGVWEHNLKAIHFYERWGFEVFSSHIFIVGDDPQTDLMMKKELTGSGA